MKLLLVYRRLDDASRQPTTSPMAYWSYYGLRVNAIRQLCKYRRITVHLMCTAHTMITSSTTTCITSLFYRASDAHGTYYFRIIVFYSWIISSWITRALLTCTACTVSCQPTVDYFVAYRASDMHGMYCILSANYGYRRLPCI